MRTFFAAQRGDWHRLNLLKLKKKNSAHGNINVISKDSFCGTICVSLTIFRECFDTFPCLNSDPKKIDHGVSNLGEELRRFDGKLDIRSCENSKPLGTRFGRGSWNLVWFPFGCQNGLIHLISFANTLHVFSDFCQIVGTKQSVATKTSTTFFPKSSPSKTEYHLATKKGPTSSNPLTSCHFVKESHGFSLCLTSLPLSSYIEVVRAPSQRWSPLTIFDSRPIGSEPTWPWRSDWPPFLSEIQHVEMRKIHREESDLETLL